MHGDATAERDVAGNRLRPQRRTAARERRRQIAHPLDFHRRCATPRRGSAAGNARWRRWLEQPGRGLHELRHRDLPLTEQLVQVIHVARPQLACDRGELFGARADARELALGQQRAGAAVAADILLAKPGAHLGAAAGRGEITLLGREPVAARRLVLAGDDLHDLAVGEHVAEGRNAPVRLGAAAAVSERGVHLVGEIERRCAARQIDHLALGCEHVDAVLEELRAHPFDEIAVRFRPRRGTLLRLEEPAYPFDLALVVGIARAALLVGPVRRHPELGVLVHLGGADLDLDALCQRSDHGGVDGAVAVALRGRDVVVELSRDVGPAPVHHPERRVAVRDRGHHHAHGTHVEELLERQLLALHLAVDAVDMFRAAVDLGRDARRTQLLLQLPAQRLDVALAVRTALVQCAGDAPVLLGLEIPEGEVLELPLQLPDAEAIGERRVDGAGLEGASLALGLAECARVAQRDQLLGEPCQHQARVAHHRKQHLAQRLGLARVESLGRRPVARQAECAEALQGDRDIGGALSDDAGGLLGGEARARQHRSREQRVRELGALGEPAHDLGGFRGEGQILR